jgi:hypothetical protein
MGKVSVPARPLKLIILASLFLLGLWFLANEVAYSVTRDRSGETAVRTTALVTHMIFAAPLLLLPPVQFSRRIRMRWPILHRRLGQLYLVSALIAASLAIYLGLTFDSLGRRTPVVVFAIAWLFFSFAAFTCARRRLFAAHEKFVVRSYAMALAFVFVRVMGQGEDFLFAFLPDNELRGVTREWLCFVLPLLVVEGWQSWLPALRSDPRGSKRPESAG